MIKEATVTAIIIDKFFSFWFTSVFLTIFSLYSSILSINCQIFSLGNKVYIEKELTFNNIIVDRLEFLNKEVKII